MKKTVKTQQPAPDMVLEIKLQEALDLHTTLVKLDQILWWLHSQTQIPQPDMLPRHPDNQLSLPL